MSSSDLFFRSFMGGHLGILWVDLSAFFLRTFISSITWLSGLYETTFWGHSVRLCSMRGPSGCLCNELRSSMKIPSGHLWEVHWVVYEKTISWSIRGLLFGLWENLLLLYERTIRWSVRGPTGRLWEDLSQWSGLLAFCKKPSLPFMRISSSLQL